MKNRDGDHQCSWCGDLLPVGRYGSCSVECKAELRLDNKRRDTKNRAAAGYFKNYHKTMAETDPTYRERKRASARASWRRHAEGMRARGASA